MKKGSDFSYSHAHNRSMKKLMATHRDAPISRREKRSGQMIQRTARMALEGKREDERQSEAKAQKKHEDESIETKMLIVKPAWKPPTSSSSPGKDSPKRRSKMGLKMLRGMNAAGEVLGKDVREHMEYTGRRGAVSSESTNNARRSYFSEFLSSLEKADVRQVYFKDDDIEYHWEDWKHPSDGTASENGGDNRAKLNGCPRRHQVH